MDAEIVKEEREEKENEKDIEDVCVGRIYRRRMYVVVWKGCRSVH